MQNHPKRLIEVDLPIRRISEHARREKSIRHGHISTLHIWWARRPLAACRAVLCASLWPDPVDPLCPEVFRKDARDEMKRWAINNIQLLGSESITRFLKYQNKPELLDDNLTLRNALFDFIADFSNWDNSIKQEYLETSRKLTQVAHMSLGGEKGTRPLVIDPFAGGGSIPIESLRIGADVYASDLNPISVLLNKVIVEYVPKYRNELIKQFEKWSTWLRSEAENKLYEYYPKDPNGNVPIAYLWSRKIKCEGPNCGVEIPMIRSLWLAKRKNNSVSLKLSVVNDKIEIGITYGINPSKILDGTIKRGSVTCPRCGFTTSLNSVHKQLKTLHGGANTAKLLCVVTTNNRNGRIYRLPNKLDFDVINKVKSDYCKIEKILIGGISLIPQEPIKSKNQLDVGKMLLYGIDKYTYIFTYRQLITLTTLILLVKKIQESLRNISDKNFTTAILVCLSFIIDKIADKCSSLCRWKSSAEYMAGNTFGRQALSMVWDFCEASPIGEATGDIKSEIDWISKVILHVIDSTEHSGETRCQSAATNVLPNDSANLFFTDPPYYNAISYSNLSDFFYIWLKRSVGDLFPEYFSKELIDNSDECVVDLSLKKDNIFFEKLMEQCLSEGRRVLNPKGLGVVVFAHKSTKGWEAQLQAMLNAGWIITGSWPIDTEMGSRMNAMNSASLVSSIHLICRPRENFDGSINNQEVGDWRAILQELPKRIHEWMPRLALEGVVGADAIFACLGPALEIFSKYSKVEKANGEQVSLKEYLEHVWAAVSKEALNTIFQDVDVSGLEEDARITAIWLWTISTSPSVNNGAIISTTDIEKEENVTQKIRGYLLEYDTARKIAQGLGASLENMVDVVEISGDQARLLSVSERAKYLFGKDIEEISQTKKIKDIQISIFSESQLPVEEEIPESKTGKSVRKILIDTTLDKVHKTMLLFAMGRSEALKRYLVEDGIGTDIKYWKLSQALSALYPVSSDEKRWVDGVLAKKKSYGFK